MIAMLFFIADMIAHDPKNTASYLDKAISKHSGFSLKSIFLTTAHK